MENDKPVYSEGSQENEACQMVESLLNFMLNRHVHKLVEHGYLDKEKYDREYGYDEGVPRKALKLKWELINEAQRKFAEPIAKKLK